MASPKVADLADRVSGALMEITTPIETRSFLVDYHPGCFQAQDLLQVLRNSMRSELGLPGAITSGPISDDWPWLPDRPGRESYTQRRSQPPRQISE